MIETAWAYITKETNSNRSMISTTNTSRCSTTNRTKAFKTPLPAEGTKMGLDSRAKLRILLSR